MNELNFNDTPGIYRFRWDQGYGDIEGIFVATPESVEWLIGRHVDFGEVLGKHSEVYGVIESNEIELVTDDIEVVGIFQDHDLSCGYNPFEYVEDEPEEFFEGDEGDEEYE